MRPGAFAARRQIIAFLGALIDTAGLAVRGALSLAQPSK
jgi:hypothetical protein